MPPLVFEFRAGVGRDASGALRILALQWFHVRRGYLEAIDINSIGSCSHIWQEDAPSSTRALYKENFQFRSPHQVVPLCTIVVVHPESYHGRLALPRDAGR